MKWIWANTDAISKWVQVFALFVAAYWTYTRFIIVDAPSLEPKVGVLTNLTSNRSLQPQTCYVSYTVTVQNSGQTSFDVDSLAINVWRGDLTQPGADLLTPVDIDKLGSSKPILTIKPHSYALLRHYAPSASYTESFSWVMSSPQEPKLTLFRTDAFDKAGKLLNFARFWKDNVCVNPTDKPA